MKYVAEIFVLGLLLFFVGCATTAHLKTGQHPYAFTKKITKEITLPYLLYLPENYTSENKSWPLLVFLHGAGERGDSLELIKRHGPPKLVDEKKDFPFILVSPQCPTDNWWAETYMLEALEGLVAHISKSFRVDADRIYLTGLSMGGFGTWHLATRYPDKFAAIAPICGGGTAYQAAVLKNIPAWVFHGAKDEVVPLEQSKEMVEALEKAGGIVKFTVYPEAGHDSWTETYANPALYEWFLSQHRTHKK